ncbi:hypothetical protein [Okeania sp. KiyG1]|nr:hypothetical protein [Okeania sp. KiyG1]
MAHSQVESVSFTVVSVSSKDVGVAGNKRFQVFWSTIPFGINPTSS